MQGHGLYRQGEGQETPEGTECITPAQRARANPDTECRSRPNLTRSDGLPELLWSNINLEIKYLCAMED